MPGSPSAATAETADPKAIDALVEAIRRAEQRVACRGLAGAPYIVAAGAIASIVAALFTSWVLLVEINR